MSRLQVAIGFNQIRPGRTSLRSRLSRRKREDSFRRELSLKVMLRRCNSYMSDASNVRSPVCRVTPLATSLCPHRSGEISADRELSGLLCMEQDKAL